MTNKGERTNRREESDLAQKRETAEIATRKMNVDPSVVFRSTLVLQATGS